MITEIPIVPSVGPKIGEWLYSVS